LPEGHFKKGFSRNALHVAARESLYRDSGWKFYDPDAPGRF